MNRLRIASVDYLNAEPLTWGFEHGSVRDLAYLTKHPPAVIADMLSSGAVDVGLIPSIEYQRHEGLELLPGLCVGSRRRARSVLLVSRVPLKAIRSVALDTNSRTSVALLKVILAHHRLHDIEFSQASPPLPGMLKGRDAALIIGDPALTCETGELEVLDLGTAWNGMTGRPFVFAVWAKRIDTLLPEGLGPFVASHREGLAHREDTARRMAAPLALQADALEEYLNVDLHYDLGAAEVRGMDLFFRQARELDLVPGHQPIRFFSRTSRSQRNAAGASA